MVHHFETQSLLGAAHFPFLTPTPQHPDGFHLCPARLGNLTAAFAAGSGLLGSGLLRHVMTLAQRKLASATSQHFFGHIYKKNQKCVTKTQLNRHLWLRLDRTYNLSVGGKGRSGL